MDRLDFVDAIFLVLDTAENRKHVGALLVFARPEGVSPDFRVDLVAQFRKRQPEAPFNR